jgi:radical SAM superfamily enzyme YgiQ (UPF0313 family)
MRLVLVDNLLIPEKGDVSNLDLHPHLGIISLAAAAIRNGHEVSILDPKWHITKGALNYDAELYKGIANIIAGNNPDAVGFTTLGCSFIFALKVARYLKKQDKDLPILLGGPHATILHQELLAQFDEFDIVVRNEAEETLTPILEGLGPRRFKDIPGVSWRSGASVKSNPGSPTITDLDSLPFPAYDLYPMKQLGLESVRIDAGRGCPFNCTFCSTASFFGRSYRLKSPERLVAEMDDLNVRYGFTDFKLNHDLFTVNKKKVRAFCEAVLDKGYTWAVSARVDCVDDALLQHMWDAGCRGIYFGIETGSRRMQKISEKHLELDLVDPCLDVTERLGMRTIVSFITGYPQETQQDQNDTMDVLGDCFNRNRELFTTQLHMLTPEPGTQLYNDLSQQLQYDGYLTDFNASQLEIDDEQIVKDNQNIFLTYHYYPTALPRERHIFAVDAYRILRKAGHTILAYTLRLYENRFSRLIEHFWQWSRQRPEDTHQITGEFVVDFFRDNFADHHLTSLFRYALLTEHSRKLSSDTNGIDRSTVSLDFDQLYQLSPAAFLFQNIHDCVALIERIEANKSTDSITVLRDNEVGERGNYLVICKGSVHGEMDNFELDPAGFAVASLFEQPRSYRQLCASLKPYIGEEEPDKEFFKDLIALGALKQVPQSNIQNHKHSSKIKYAS